MLSEPFIVDFPGPWDPSEEDVIEPLLLEGVKKSGVEALRWKYFNDGEGIRVNWSH
jgi:hypothetical protein